MSGSRSLQNAKGNDNSRQAFTRLSPATAVSLPPVDSIERMNSILPRGDDDDGRPASLINIALSIVGKGTTLRTTVRVTGKQTRSSTQRGLLPTISTGRPSFGPSGFQTVRPPTTGPTGLQTVRPGLQFSAPISQVPVTSLSRTSLSTVTPGPVSTSPAGPFPILPVPAATATSVNALPEVTSARPSITATPSSGVDAGSVVGYIVLAAGM